MRGQCEADLLLAGTVLRLLCRFGVLELLAAERFCGDFPEPRRAKASKASKASKAWAWSIFGLRLRGFWVCWKHRPFLQVNRRRQLIQAGLQSWPATSP